MTPLTTHIARLHITKRPPRPGWHIPRSCQGTVNAFPHPRRPWRSSSPMLSSAKRRPQWPWRPQWPGALSGTGTLRSPGAPIGPGALSGPSTLNGPGSLSGFGALSGTGALSGPGVPVAPAPSEAPAPWMAPSTILSGHRRRLFTPSAPLMVQLSYFVLNGTAPSAALAPSATPASSVA